MISHLPLASVDQADPEPSEIERLRAVLEALPIGVTLQDDSGCHLLVNAAASDLAGTRGEREIETAAREIVLHDRTYRLTTSSDVTDQRRLVEELFDRAYVDELTGLPNRALMDRSARQLIEGLGPGQRFALAFIDIDNFKHINDFYSHTAGDALLLKIANRMSSCLRETDVLARIGGDEFLLILTPVTDVHDATAMLGRLAARLADPFFIEGHEIFASASIGVSVFPDQGATYDVIRRNADCAMYRAKSSQKGLVVVFDGAFDQAATARMALEQRFRLAIRDRRFTCAFQPKVDIRSHEILGVEVLLRWRDEHGVIRPPGDFVALAIELGLIDEITHLLLAEVAASIEEIDDAFGAGVTISFNIAAKQAIDPDFMTGFCQALTETGSPARFMVEITEEAFLDKDTFQSTILPKLRAIGVKVSIDDFGVGYSSLAALADIEADELKIDRSFITDIHLRPRSQSILKAIEQLAQVLNMSVIAEGVETYEELVWLQASTGIRAAQGYYFARPLFLGQERKSDFEFRTRAMTSGRPPVTTRASAILTR